MVESENGTNGNETEADKTMDEGTPVTNGVEKKKKKKKNKNKNDDEIEAEVEQKKDAVVDDGWSTQGRNGKVLAEGEADPARLKAKAKAEAESIQAEEDKGPQKDSLEVRIDPKYYGNIIGKGGSRLKMLCEGTGAEIDMPRKETGSHVVTIKGSQEEIAAAKKGLTELVQDGYCAHTDPGTTSMELKASSRDLRLIVGERGKNIQALQDATGVRINTPARDSKSDRVTIVGQVEGVIAAKHAIEALLEKGFSQITHPNWNSVQVSFPTELRASLIGTKGATIQALESTYQVKITVPEIRGVREIQLVVAGTSESIDAACKEIRQLTVIEEVPMEAAWGGTAAGFDLTALNSWDLP